MQVSNDIYRNVEVEAIKKINQLLPGPNHFIEQSLLPPIVYNTSKNFERNNTFLY